MASIVVFSQALYADDMFAAQRDLFSRVEGDMKQGKFNSFRLYATKLSGYPLFPYLKFYEMRRRLSFAKASEIRNFLHEHERLPVAERLRHQWIRHLGKRGDWQTIVDIYRPPRMLEGKKMKCYYAQALIHTQQLDTLMQLLPDLWLVKFSQPKQCDFVFNWAFSNNAIDDQLIWKRLLLVIRKNSGLTRYLGGRLSQDNRHWYPLLKKASSNPTAVLSRLQKIFSDSPPLVIKDIALRALKSLARRNVDKADDYFQQFYNDCRQCFSMILLQREWGISLAQQLEARMAYRWLQQLPERYHTEESKYWQIRAALRLENWKYVLRSINLLDTKQRALAQWQYWYARALYASGQQQQALRIWKTLSGQANYYGYLSADKVGRDYRLSSPLIAFPNSELNRFAARGAISRMHELVRLNRMVDVQREYLFIADFTTKNEYLKLALLAQQWGWYDGAIRAIAASDIKGDMQLRFPSPYADEVKDAVKKSKVPEELIYGIMRRESAFIEKIKSPAGALGLMQLMPNTARMMASKLKIHQVKSQWQILYPETNILIGAYYFGRLYRQYKQRIVPALATYNAGGTHVRRWLNKTPVSRQDIWVDTIPINETRLYVRAVLFYSTVYAHKLGKTVKRLEHLMQ